MCENMAKKETDAKKAQESKQDVKSLETKDSLLDCLVIIGQLLDQSTSSSSLKAGLPLVDGKLTPELFIRAAGRANLKAYISNKPLDQFSHHLFPCVLLLKDGGACVLVKKVHDKYQVYFPDDSKKAREVTLEDLNKNYEGHAIFVQAHAQVDSEKAAKKKAGRSWLWGTLAKFWPIYSQVIVASVFINFFTLVGAMFTLTVYDRVVPNNATETLWVLVIGVVIIFFFDFLLRSLRGYFVDTAGKNADVLLASLIFERVMNLRLDSKPGSAGTFANQLREFESLREFFSSASLAALVDLPFIFLFIFVIYIIGGPVAYIPMIMVPIVLLVSYILQGPLGASIHTTFLEHSQKHGVLVEAIHGLETVKGLNAEGKVQRKWENFVDKSAKSSTLTRLISAMAVNFSIFSQNLTTVGVIIVGVYQIGMNNLTLGGLIACSILAGRAMAPLTQVVSLLTRYNQSMEAFKQLNSIMDLPVERPKNKRFLHRPHFEGEIEFKDVKFAYPDQKLYTLKELSFKIKPGEKVALLGKIGSGKSTIEKLVMGLYEPEAGAVLIDGTDIRQIDPADLRSNISYIPQDIYLFRGTIRDNIAMGAEHVDDETILKASQLSGVHDFVSKHPLGYDIPVGEGGANLSGGQRQSVAVARALVRDPSLFIFDEPSAMMDQTTERGLIERLQFAIKDKTLILVTHRPSLLALVDRVIIIDNGQVVADGPRDKVLDALKKQNIHAAG